jgi:hypothetical protein
MAAFMNRLPSNAGPWGGMIVARRARWIIARRARFDDRRKESKVAAVARRERFSLSAWAATSAPSPRQRAADLSRSPAVMNRFSRATGPWWGSDPRERYPTAPCIWAVAPCRISGL